MNTQIGCAQTPILKQVSQENNQEIAIQTVLEWWLPDQPA